MPNINIGSTAQEMYDVCNEVREAFTLDWDNCVNYSFDTTNPMIGKRSSLLQNIRIAQGGQKIFDVGCACHLAHLCTGKRSKELFVIDIYYHFRRSAKCKKQLRELMNFNNILTKSEK